MAEPGRCALGAAILAGGASRRMGRPKALLRLGAETLLERQVRLLAPLVGELLVVGEGLEAAGVRVPAPARAVGDGAWPRAGPLAGLVAALENSRARRLWCRGVDMPFVVPAVLGRLEELAVQAAGCAAVVPLDRQGRPQPLAAVYVRELALPPLAAALARGERALLAAVGALQPLWVPAACLEPLDPELLSLRGLNTPAEYAAARRRLEQA
ncbi:MAG: putative molybdenum cofactor guanylyltransferase [Planctomycetota bacterium]|nr:MAG: putative molybdenum cofactor guanylyltransferase [Planctomycetota bacterium]